VEIHLSLDLVRMIDLALVGKALPVTVGIYISGVPSTIAVVLPDLYGGLQSISHLCGT
jgi:hypothetical protein